MNLKKYIVLPVIALTGLGLTGCSSDFWIKFLWTSRLKRLHLKQMITSKRMPGDCMNISTDFQRMVVIHRPIYRVSMIRII